MYRCMAAGISQHEARRQSGAATSACGDWWYGWADSFDCGCALAGAVQQIVEDRVGRALVAAEPPQACQQVLLHYVEVLKHRAAGLVRVTLFERLEDLPVPA